MGAWRCRTAVGRSGAMNGRPLPYDVERKEFAAAADGYDRTEVRSFLIEVADDLRMLEAAVREARTLALVPESDVGQSRMLLLEAVTEEARMLLDEASRGSEALRRAAVQEATAAQAAARAALAVAERQAREVLDGARTEAERMVERSRAACEASEAAVRAIGRRVADTAEKASGILAQLSVPLPGRSDEPENRSAM